MNLPLYKVTSFGRPVTIRKDIGEEHPCHADMLRYDTAFHDPNDPSRIVFPKIKGYSNKITKARWDSFVLKVGYTDEYVRFEDIQDWLTYTPMDLKPQTLAAYLERTKRQVIG